MSDSDNYDDSDNDEKASVHNSDSEHEFMDLEVQGVCNNNSALVVKNIETSNTLVVKNN